MKKQYIILSVVLILILISVTIFAIPRLIGDEKGNPDAQTHTNTDENKTLDPEETDPLRINAPKTTPTTPVVVPPEMQTVISNHTDEIYVDESGLLAGNYPNQMIPLYKVSSVSESYQITGASESPGWNATYVSDETSGELLAFYQDLLSSIPEHTEETLSETTTLKGTVSGYNVTVSVSPNNVERTAIPGNSAVTIFIEEV